MWCKSSIRKKSCSINPEVYLQMLCGTVEHFFTFVLFSTKFEKILHSTTEKQKFYKNHKIFTKFYKNHKIFTKLTKIYKFVINSQIFVKNYKFITNSQNFIKNHKILTKFMKKLQNFNKIHKIQQNSQNSTAHLMSQMSQ